MRHDRTEKEREDMIIKNLNLVYYVVDREYPTYFTNEDVIQQAKIGLIKAVDAYDETKGAFSSFAYRCIKNAVTDYLRKEQRENHDQLSLDNAITDQQGTSTSLYQRVLGKQGVQYLDLAGYKATLRPRQLQVFQLLETGLPKKQIAEQLGVSVGYIQSVTRNLKKKWRDFF